MDLKADPDSTPATPAASPSTPQLHFYPLDPRAVALWRLSAAINLGLLVVLLTGVSLGVVWTQAPGGLPWYAVAWCVAVGLCAWMALWLPQRSYCAWGFRLDDQVLEVKHGLLFQVSQLVPLSRLQHIDLRRGPLERTFGLASVLLHTAGTREATIIIPGLDAAYAARLRDHLVEKGRDHAAAQ